MVNQYNPGIYYPQKLDLYGGRYEPAFYRAMFPASHALTRANGAQISIAWDVRNDGDTLGHAKLLVTVGAQILLPDLPAPVSPGSRVGLIRIITLSGQPIGQQVSARVEMVETDSEGGILRSLGTHDFTVTITTVGPILVAVEGPTIT